MEATVISERSGAKAVIRTTLYLIFNYTEELGSRLSGREVLTDSSATGPLG